MPFAASLSRPDWRLSEGVRRRAAGLTAVAIVHLGLALLLLSLAPPTLKKKFVDMAALQCGICTPGFLIASRALLAKTPNPTETEVRYWLAGNLCRCTGYDKIVNAVLEVAAEMRAAAE